LSLEGAFLLWSEFGSEPRAMNLGSLSDHCKF
jgi:hypothetical protein